jgi:hypothetical protein
MNEIVIRRKVLEWMIKEGIRKPLEVLEVIDTYYYNPEKVLKTIMGNAKIQYTLSQQESEDQPKTASNTQGKVEKINFVKTFDTPELAAKFKRLIPKDFAEKTSVEGGKITVSDITDPQKKNLMATALKFIADNAPKKKPIKEGVKDQIRKAIEEVIREKKLTKAELKKKEDIVKAMKGTTDLPAPAIYAIATDKAKKLAENAILRKVLNKLK